MIGYKLKGRKLKLESLLPEDIESWGDIENYLGEDLKSLIEAVKDLENKNMKSLAAILKLKVLKVIYNRDRDPDYNLNNNTIWVIKKLRGSLVVVDAVGYEEFLAFETRSQATEFLNKFYDIVEDAYEI